MRFYLIFIFPFLSLVVLGQEKVIVADFEIINDDTIFLSDISEVKILEFKNLKEKSQYHILKRRVLKVYPYAVIANEKLQSIHIGLDTISKRRHKKRYTKEVARWVKEEYTDRLKNLTMSEGKILVKLIYRETRATSYDIVKHYRGIFNAFFWQTMAKLWDNNLKTEYDPANIREDMLIEHIIIQARLEGHFD